MSVALYRPHRRGLHHLDDVVVTVVVHPRRRAQLSGPRQWVWCFANGGESLVHHRIAHRLVDSVASIAASVPPVLA